VRSKYEIRSHKELQSEGHVVDYKVRPRMVARGYTVDYFGLFDLMAWDGKGSLRLIAIKGHQGVPAGLRAGIREFKPTEVVKEIWTYRDDGSVKKEIVE
jgi:hypothetical protein